MLSSIVLSATLLNIFLLSVAYWCVLPALFASLVLLMATAKKALEDGH